MPWYERVGAEAADWVEEQISKLIHAGSTRDVVHLAKSIIGYEAFSIGFDYGLINHPLSELKGLGELVKIFVLADVHEYFFMPMGAATRAMAPMGPASALARRWLTAFNGPSSFGHRTEAAYREREEVLAELKAVMADPLGFLEGVPGRLKDELTTRWRQYQELRAKPDPRSQFEAGKIAGDVTMEILLLLAGLIAAGATVVKVAGKVPRLLEWARALRTPARVGNGTGASMEALGSSAVRSPKPAAKPLAPKQIVETTDAPEPLAVAPKRYALTGVTAAEFDLAAAPTSTYPDVAASQIAARRKMAKQFYREQSSWMSPEDIDSHVSGIDLSKPVKVGPPPPAPAAQYQWQVPGARQGNYYADAGTQPTNLGINARGRGMGADGKWGTGPIEDRVVQTYEVPPDTPYLESTAAPYLDKHSVRDMPTMTEGGGMQRYIPALKK